MPRQPCSACSSSSATPPTSPRATKHGRDWLITPDAIDAYQANPPTRGRPKKGTKAMQTQLWQDKTSGERYVVTVNESGKVIDATGPLHHSEIDRAMGGDFDSSPELVEDLNTYADNYRVK